MPASSPLALRLPALDILRPSSSKRWYRKSLGNMASQASFDNLVRQFQHLSPLDRYPDCFPDLNPVDVYRSHITSILHEITGVDTKIIYPALQWTATLEKGDLMLPIPALRVKGKPDELGKQWLEKVPYPSIFPPPHRMSSALTKDGLAVA